MAMETQDVLREFKARLEAITYGASDTPMFSTVKIIAESPDDKDLKALPAAVISVEGEEGDEENPEIGELEISVNILVWAPAGQGERQMSEDDATGTQRLDLTLQQIAETVRTQLKHFEGSHSFVSATFRRTYPPVRFERGAKAVWMRQLEWEVLRG